VSPAARSEQRWQRAAFLLAGLAAVQMFIPALGAVISEIS